MIEWKSTDMEESDTGALEALDETGFGRIWESGFSDERECRVAGLGASFDDEFSDVSGASDDQNFAFLGHFWKIPARLR